MVISLAAVLAGCAQTAYQITSAPLNKDASGETIDSTQCNEESRINSFTRILFCGIGAAICRSVMDGRYEKCMRARGYQLRPIP